MLLNVFNRLQVWLQVLGADETPCYPHPEGKTYGVTREDGEWLVYIGRLHLIVTPVRAAPETRSC